MATYDIIVLGWPKTDRYEYAIMHGYCDENKNNRIPAIVRKRHVTSKAKRHE